MRRWKKVTARMSIVFDTAGTSLVEYVLILALVSGLCVAALSALGGAISNNIDKANQASSSDPVNTLKASGPTTENGSSWHNASGHYASGMDKPAPVGEERQVIANGGPETLIGSRLNNLSSSFRVWGIKPNRGQLMREYGDRFANTWLAAEANNWDMVRYQALKMSEVREIGEATWPSQHPSWQTFEERRLRPLTEAAKQKDPTVFIAAYDEAITGCNACHSLQTSPDFPKGYNFIKVQRPSAVGFHNIDWSGQ
jgi:Flp pilus assembly pilin Flp